MSRISNWLSDREQIWVQLCQDAGWVWVQTGCYDVAGGQDGVGMLPSVLGQGGLPCPWIENAVMTSWASTPAGNYRTNHVTASPRTCTGMRPCPHVQDGDTQQPAPRQYLSISPMQSSRWGPMHLQQIQSGNRERKRDSCYLHTQPAGIPLVFLILALLWLTKKLQLVTRGAITAAAFQGRP